MYLEKFKELNTILERDATDTTYKYALLRGLSEICQHCTHYMELDEDRAWFPLGLLVDKWLLYYYPIFASTHFIPQKPSEQGLDKPGYKISFRKQFSIITSYYEDKGGLSVFYNDYRKGRIPDEINYELLELLKKLRYTITRYPMKHLGYSVTKEHYKFFEFKRGGRIRKQPVTQELVVDKFGRFSISRELFEIFNLVGGFISGEHSILNKWAKFTVHSDKTGSLSQNEVLDILTIQPITERDVRDIVNLAESMLYKEGQLTCVWTGRKIRSKSDLHIDHVIPFSVWSNNDLWNLLPTHKDTNIKKRDQIPSPKLLEKRKTVILNYWRVFRSHFTTRFDSETRLSLIGASASTDILIEAFVKLREKAEYLIELYGYQEWDI